MALLEGKVEGGGTGLRLGPISIGAQYTVGVRFVNYLGKWSEWVTATEVQVTAGDPGAPGLPTAVSGVAGGNAGTADLAWTNPVEANLASIEIWMAQANDSAQATFWVSVSAPAETTTAVGLPESANCYFWLKARNLSGDVSAFHAGVNAGVHVITN